MAEVRFEYDYYLPGDMVGIVYQVYTLGYSIIVRDPDDETIFGVPALIGNNKVYFRLYPWAKEGTYVVRLLKTFTQTEVDSDQMSVGVIIKKVVFGSSPPGAKVVTKKV